jgi:hypothetical protein
MTRHVKKVARFFVMQSPARQSRLTKDMIMISDEQRRTRCRQIDMLVSQQVRLRILPACDRRRRNHSPLLLQLLILGNAIGILLSRTLHPILLETTGRTPLHMDHIPATDLIGSAWSIILATTAMAIRSRNHLLKWRRLHHHRLVFRAAHKSRRTQSLIYSTANYWRVIMRIRLSNFHQSRTRTHFELHSMLLKDSARCGAWLLATRIFMCTKLKC